tara:strand:+ start:2331 stop:3263 length:933 start_codon:yes stop_codon:yes gene_type:complete
MIKSHILSRLRVLNLKRFIGSYIRSLLALVMGGYLAAVSANEQQAKPETLRIPAQVTTDNQTYAYYVEVLKLALETTSDRDSAIRVIPDPLNANQNRLLRQIKVGSTDVTWAVTTEKREREYLAVYFPVARGLFGYRVFLIHPDNRALFVNKSPKALKQDLSVQGMGWPDSEIMRFNGYRVEEVPTTMMFKLIESKMADFFPRSVIEVENELSNLSSNQLAVAPSIAFYYPSPSYFFVNKQNKKLAQRIKQGLDKALTNGKLLRLYAQQPFAKSANTMLLNRRIIALKNPLLTLQSRQTLKRYNAFLLKE